MSLLKNNCSACLLSNKWARVNLTLLLQVLLTSSTIPAASIYWPKICILTRTTLESLGASENIGDGWRMGYTKGDAPGRRPRISKDSKAQTNLNYLQKQSYKTFLKFWVNECFWVGVAVVEITATALVAIVIAGVMVGRYIKGLMLQMWAQEFNSVHYKSSGGI